MQWNGHNRAKPGPGDMGALLHALRLPYRQSPSPAQQEAEAGVEVTPHPSVPPHSQRHVHCTPWPNFHSCKEPPRPTMGQVLDARG